MADTTVNVKLPVITNYGQYSSDNYGVNTLHVDLGEIEFWYSYKTIVAYRDIHDGFIVCENAWGVTTGKHLNWISRDHSRRLDSGSFDVMLEYALKRHVH